jgi:hypothetical protein
MVRLSLQHQAVAETIKRLGQSVSAFAVNQQRLEPRMVVALEQVARMETAGPWLAGSQVHMEMAGVARVFYQTVGTSRRVCQLFMGKVGRVMQMAF